MKLLRTLLTLALVLAPFQQALAGAGTITVKDAAGATKTFVVVTDGSTNFLSSTVLCDQSAGATCASVGTAGSPSTNALTTQAVTLGSGTAANAARVELANNGTGLLATVTTLTGGGVASAAADSGNPLKIGGKYNSTPITLTDGNRGDLQLDVNGYAKVNVTNANANGQAAMASSSPVVLASNQTAADPCMFQNKSNLAINQNGTSSVQLIGLSGSTVIYVCSLSLIAAGATTVALTTGTGSACVTGNAAVIGTTTANIANSVSFAANGGMTIGNGQGTIAKGAASSELCMILGASVYVSGNLTYVQQ